MCRLFVYRLVEIQKLMKLINVTLIHMRGLQGIGMMNFHYKGIFKSTNSQEIIIIQTLTMMIYHL